MKPKRKKVRKLIKSNKIQGLSTWLLATQFFMIHAGMKHCHSMSKSFVINHRSGGCGLQLNPGQIRRKWCPLPKSYSLFCDSIPVFPIYHHKKPAALELQKERCLSVECVPVHGILHCCCAKQWLCSQSSVQHMKLHIFFTYSGTL